MPPHGPMGGSADAWGSNNSPLPAHGCNGIQRLATAARIVSEFVRGSPRGSKDFQAATASGRMRCPPVALEFPIRVWPLCAGLSEFPRERYFMRSRLRAGEILDPKMDTRQPREGPSGVAPASLPDRAGVAQPRSPSAASRERRCCAPGRRCHFHQCSYMSKTTGFWGKPGHETPQSIKVRARRSGHGTASFSSGRHADSTDACPNACHEARFAAIDAPRVRPLPCDVGCRTGTTFDYILQRATNDLAMTTNVE